MDDLSSLSPLERVEALKAYLTEYATGVPSDQERYLALRTSLRSNSAVYARLPDFVRSCTNVAEFWSFIKAQCASYQDRRNFLRTAFAPIIEQLEQSEDNPGVLPITDTLQRFDAESVHAAWDKALARRANDPEGAITAARTMLESVCKHILDDENVSYPADADLPRLWRLVAERLNLVPEQHQDEMFKRILGNCQAVVLGLATIRNNVGDAHGSGRRPVRPKMRHAELVVNLAGTMAAFLVATWIERTDKPTVISGPVSNSGGVAKKTN